MTPETQLKNKIMIDCGKRNWLCFHINVGSVQLPNGSFFSTGVPNGWPDLLILTDHGQAMFVETKIRPRRPTTEQKEMIKKLNDRKFAARVIYDFDEWLEFVRDSFR